MDLETGTTTKEYGEGGSTTTTTSFLTTAYAISFSDFLLVLLLFLLFLILVRKVYQYAFKKDKTKKKKLVVDMTSLNLLDVLKRRSEKHRIESHVILSPVFEVLSLNFREKKQDRSRRKSMNF